ncbi:Gfo/Idh/MocA family protein [Haloarchaeobius sp. DFWS5]|uniref:Gfo/Idh/MocA family protein n=1 Tax=Haloarchaeobius sp. DFWS5 TaxID=3446114 RepID=UPI003EB9D2B1
MTLDVAILGTGPDPDADGDHDGYSMGYRHANAYAAVDGCELVACADLDEENAAAFASNYDLPEDSAYTDHTEMLADASPDLVSVCTPPASHDALVTDCAEAGAAIHCEKPMATTWEACTSLVATCEALNVQLTFNFQNRFRPVVDKIDRLLDGGAIGEVERVEVHRADLMQTGIHNLDLATHFAGDTDLDWVLGAVDASSGRKWYTNMYAEDQGLAQFRYENGVDGLVVTGEGTDEAASLVRVEGTRGCLELSFWSETPLRVRRDGGDWEAVGVPDGDAQVGACREVVNALREERPCELRAERALRVTELVFGVWESARTSGRVDFPLDVSGNPLAAIVEDE